MDYVGEYQNPGCAIDCLYWQVSLTMRKGNTHITLRTAFPVHTYVITLKYPPLSNLQEECVSWTASAGTQAQGEKRMLRASLRSKQLTTPLHLIVERGTDMHQVQPSSRLANETAVGKLALKQ